jgi:hypothetical protein
MCATICTPGEEGGKEGGKEEGWASKFREGQKGKAREGGRGGGRTDAAAACVGVDARSDHLGDLLPLASEAELDWFSRGLGDERDGAIEPLLVTTDFLAVHGENQVLGLDARPSGRAVFFDQAHDIRPIAELRTGKSRGGHRAQQQTEGEEDVRDHPGGNDDGLLQRRAVLEEVLVFVPKRGRKGWRRG